MRAQFDPSFYVGLHSIDLEPFQTPDGRDHYIDANSPVSLVSAPIPDVVTDPGTIIYGPGGITIPIPGAQTAAKLYDSVSMPKHFGARVAVSVLAIGLLLVVAFRLTT